MNKVVTWTDIVIIALIMISAMIDVGRNDMISAIFDLILVIILFLALILVAIIKKGDQ